MMNLLFSLHARISSVISSEHLGVVFHTSSLLFFLKLFFLRHTFAEKATMENADFTVFLILHKYYTRNTGDMLE